DAGNPPTLAIEARAGGRLRKRVVGGNLPALRRSDRYVIKFFKVFYHGPAKFRRGRADLQRPGHDVDVVLFQQRLEPRQFVPAPMRVMAVEEAPDHEVRLACAAMPGAEPGAGKTGGKIGRIG